MRVLLVGNYAPDGQQSMVRYAAMLLDGLRASGHQVSLIVPRPVLNRHARAPAGVWKWVGYLDKMVVAPRDIESAAQQADIVHICDHSNAFYVPRNPARPCVVTCHDLLAVRGALGEDTDCPATFMGKQLQHGILAGLGRAQAVACVSGATLHDARRLLADYQGLLEVTPNALNHPYRVLAAGQVRERLHGVPALREGGPYVLHVGSNLRRKNRECALRAVAGIADKWQGRIVFAGQPLTAELRALAARLGIAARIVEVAGPDNDLLEALYNGALALLFPSRFEGFGWPIVEAQACGCPVICSDREPFPEVAGDAALLCDADDDVAFGKAILALGASSEMRDGLIRRGLDNTRRYARDIMVAQFTDLYARLRAAA